MSNTHQIDYQQERSPQAESFASYAATYDPLHTMLFALRWVITAMLLAITLTWPVRTTTGPELWLLVVLFGFYNGVFVLLQRYVSMFVIARWVPLLDLLVIGGLYVLDPDPAGVMFTLFVVALLSAVATMTTRAAISYTLVTLAIVAFLAPLLPSWSTDPVALRLFCTRLIMLALVGIGAACLVQQISRNYAVAYTERMEMERLAELERLRANFVASISHDLSTPLTAINAGLGLLETSLVAQLRPDQERLLRNARRNGEQLQVLIGDLLTYNKLKTATFMLEREPINLRAVVLNAAAGVQALLQAKRQVLELDLAPELSLVGDRHRLEQVVTNLLANAHKHTPPGTQIRLSAVAHEAQVHLTVSDSGPGIPPAAHALIFAPFQHLNTNSDGSGLGLAIIKTIVELHGGRVWVESSVGAGATFHIILPQHTGEPAGQEE